MNNSILYQSLLQITDYEHTVQLSVNVYKYLKKLLYTDNKFIKAVNNEDIEIAKCLSKYIVHKDLLDWKTPKKPCEQKYLSNYYYATYEWIKVFRSVNLTLSTNEALLNRPIKDTRILFLLIDDQSKMSPELKQEFSIAAHKIIKNDRFENKHDFEILTKYIDTGNIYKEFIQLIGLDLLKQDNYKLLSYLVRKLPKSKILMIIKKALNSDDIEILKHIDDIISYVDANLVQYLFMSHLYKRFQFIDYFESKGYKFSIDLKMFIKISSNSYNIDTITKAFSYRNFELTYDTVIKIIRDTTRYDVIDLLGKQGVKFDQEMVIICMTQKYGYEKINEIRLYNSVNITNNMFERALFLGHDFLDALLDHDGSPSDDILLRAIYSGNVNIIESLLRHNLVHSEAYKLAQELGLTNVIKLLDKYNDKSGNRRSDNDRSNNDDRRCDSRPKEAVMKEGATEETSDNDSSYEETSDNDEGRNDSEGETNDDNSNNEEMSDSDERVVTNERTSVSSSSEQQQMNSDVQIPVNDKKSEKVYFMRHNGRYVKICYK